MKMGLALSTDTFKGARGKTGKQADREFGGGDHDFVLKVMLFPGMESSKNGLLPGHD